MLSPKGAGPQVWGRGLFFKMEEWERGSLYPSSGTGKGLF